MKVQIHKIKGETYVTTPIQEDLLEKSPVLVGRRTITGFKDGLSMENTRQIVASTKKLGYGIQLLDESNLDQIKSLETWDFESVRELYERYEAGMDEEWQFLNQFEVSEREKLLNEANVAIYEETIRFLPI